MMLGGEERRLLGVLFGPGREFMDPMTMANALVALIDVRVERALESALENRELSEGSGPQGRSSAQTRTSEESSRSSSEESGSHLSTVAGAAKESASSGPARAATENGDARPVKSSSGGGPRRSADSKKGVRPIQRTT